MASQDALYEEAAGEYGAALERLAGSYEADRDKRRDLLQDIHLAIWRTSKGSPAIARCVRGCIASHTTWRPRT
jgi:DNA-directed RNA polymerase specialized sigma24 family protein